MAVSPGDYPQAPRVTTGTNPNAALTEDQVRALAIGAGFTGANIDIAVAVAHAESGFFPTHISPTNDYGLWQINKTWHGSQYDFSRLATSIPDDMAYNAHAAFVIANGGTTWSAWATFNSQNGKPPKYLQYLPASATHPEAQAQISTLLAGLSGHVGMAFDVPPPVQAPMDTRMQYPSGPFRSAIAKGQIVGETDPAIGYVVKFLYNPNEINFAYSIDLSVKDPSQQDQTQMLVGLPQGTSTTITFQILFDRTFECADGSQLGVLQDIQALEWLCHVSSAFPYMLPNRVKLMFGQTPEMVFIAYLNSMNVRMTHFNSSMVPMRCIVDITAMRMAEQNGSAAPTDPTAAPAPAATTTMPLGTGQQVVMPLGTGQKSVMPLGTGQKSVMPLGGGGARMP